MMDDLEIIERLDAIVSRLDTIAAGLTKIHVWQAARPSAADIADRLEEVLKTYGLTAQLVEVWRKQRFEIQTISREILDVKEEMRELKKVLKVKAVGDEERG